MNTKQNENSVGADQFVSNLMNKIIKKNYWVKDGCKYTYYKNGEMIGRVCTLSNINAYVGFHDHGKFQMRHNSSLKEAKAWVEEKIANEY